jgi:hypothetical protein
MTKVGYPLMLTVDVFCQLSIERFFAQVQLNMPSETKSDCETEKHHQLTRNQPFATVTENLTKFMAT